MMNSLKKFNSVNKISSIILFLILLIFPFYYLFFLKTSKLELALDKQIRPDSERLHPVKEFKPFVILIPSYNNLKFFERNLNSVLQQNYSNYRVIYIDDCSNDGMSEKIQEYLENSPKKHLVTYIRNPQRRLAMENIFRGIHACKDDEIFVSLDGDDWLAHSDVLKELNRYYANPDVWVTYGKAIDPKEPEKVFGSLIPKKVEEEKSYRSYPQFYFSALRTGYAKLLKRMRLSDMLFEGSFLRMTSDMAFAYALTEMAQHHTYLADQILYMINRENPINDSKVNAKLQLALDHYIRTRPKYPSVKSVREIGQNKKNFGLLIFSRNNPLYLQAVLESAYECLSPINEINVYYFASDEKMKKGYEHLKQNFPQVCFADQNLFSLGLAEIPSLSSYTLVMNDQYVFKKKINLEDYGYYLDALGFKSFSFNKYIDNSPGKSVKVTDKVSALQICNSLQSKLFSDEFPIAIFKTEELPLFEWENESPFFEEVYQEWFLKESPQQVVGILDELLVVKLPDLNHNFSKKEKGLASLLNGKKIDIHHPLESIEAINHNSH